MSNATGDHAFDVRVGRTIASALDAQGHDAPWLARAADVPLDDLVAGISGRQSFAMGQLHQVITVLGLTPDDIFPSAAADSSL